MESDVLSSNYGYQGKIGSGRFSNAAKNYNICHIDDDSDFLHLFRLKFSRYFKVDSFELAEDALEKVLNGDYDAVVTDYDMPVMNGIQILEAIRQKMPLLPVIFCTGQGSEDLVRRVLMMGASDYFTKNLYENAQKETLANSIIRAIEASTAHIERHEIEENYMVLVEAAGLPVFKINTDGVFVFMNSCAAAAVGGKPEDFIGKTMFEVFPEPVASWQMGKVLEVINTGIPATTYNETVLQNQVRFYETKLFPVRDYHGRINSIIATSQDITERQNMEKELKAREAHFKLLYEDAPVPYQSMDTNGNLVEVNREWLETLGYEREEVLGTYFGDYLTEKYRSVFPEKFKEFLLNGYADVVEFELIKKDGNTIFVQYNGKISRDKDGSFLKTHCIFRDITRTKRAEQRFVKVAEEMPCPLAIVNSSGEIEFLNREFVRVFGYNQHELKTINDWHNMIFPDKEYRQKAYDTWITDFEKSVKTVVQDRIFQVKTKSGKFKNLQFKLLPVDESRRCLVCEDITKIVKSELLIKSNDEKFRSVLQNMPVMLDAFDEAGNIVVWNKECERITGYSADEMVNNPQAMNMLYPDPDYYEMVMDSFKRNQLSVRDKEWIITCKDGKEKTIAWSSISGEFPVTGWASWAIGVDVTDRKSIQEDLRAKNKELIDFTYRVSHDLKNPLYILKGYLSLIKAQPEDFEEFYSKASFQMDRILSLINSLLTLSRAGRIIGEKVDIDLREIVRRSFVEHYISSSEADLAMQQECVPVRIDPDSFSLVINNLMQNAFRYKDPDKEKLKIDFKIVRNGSSTTLVFADNGKGMDEKELSRIFQTGYTSNKKIGNGFGLSIVQKIVEAHNGAIRAESKGKKQGSVFYICLND